MKKNSPANIEAFRQDTFEVGKIFKLFRLFVDYLESTFFSVKSPHEPIL